MTGVDFIFLLTRRNAGVKSKLIYRKGKKCYLLTVHLKIKLVDTDKRCSQMRKVKKKNNQYMKS